MRSSVVTQFPSAPMIVGISSSSIGSTSAIETSFSTGSGILASTSSAVEINRLLDVVADCQRRRICRMVLSSPKNYPGPPPSLSNRNFSALPRLPSPTPIQMSYIPLHLFSQRIKHQLPPQNLRPSSTQFPKPSIQFKEYNPHTMSSSQPAARSTSLNRDTNETKIQLSLNLDGGALEPFQPSEFWDNLEKNGEVKKSSGHAAQSSKSQIIEVDSGIGFLDHMLHALAKHAGWSLRIRCRGDLHSTFIHQFCYT